MDERLKCETGNHQNTRGEKRKKTLWPQLQQFLPWHVSKDKGMKTKMNDQGAPGWRSRLSVQLQPGHDLAVREFEPLVRLRADGSEPGACFRFCVSLSLCPSPVHALSLSVPKINKHWKKIKKKKRNLKKDESKGTQSMGTGLTAWPWCTSWEVRKNKSSEGY